MYIAIRLIRIKSETINIIVFLMLLAPKTMKLSSIVDKHFQKLVEIKEQSREDKKIHHESAIQRLDTLNSLLQKVLEREVKK